MARGVNKVAASAIRVDADEVTYNLHILVRFDLELALLREELRWPTCPRPGATGWSVSSATQPQDDRRGRAPGHPLVVGRARLLPDLHARNLYAAAVAEAMRADVDIEGCTAAGDFAPILAWLRDRIHRHGHVYSGEELMQRATGRPLGHDPFMRYLTTKYGALYGLDG
jgi:carboxypeptidase Taq